MGVILLLQKSLTCKWICWSWNEIRCLETHNVTFSPAAQDENEKSQDNYKYGKNNRKMQKRECKIK